MRAAAHFDRSGFPACHLSATQAAVATQIRKPPTGMWERLNAKADASFRS